MRKGNLINSTSLNQDNAQSYLSAKAQKAAAHLISISFMQDLLIDLSSQKMIQSTAFSRKDTRWDTAITHSTLIEQIPWDKNSLYRAKLQKYTSPSLLTSASPSSTKRTDALERSAKSTNPLRTSKNLTKASRQSIDRKPRRRVQSKKWSKPINGPKT